MKPNTILQSWNAIRRTRWLRIAAALASLAGICPLSADAQQPALTGRELYLSACAACHAPDGKGMPKSVVGFDTPLPDLTACSFATPEADADWFAVAHSGGPVRAFDRRMPAFGEALARTELTSVLGHIRTFCTDRAWPRGELNMPRALVTGKAFPENEAVMSASAGGDEDSSFATTWIYEKRFGARNQFEVAIPLGFRESADGDWQTAVGDVALSLKRAIFHSLDRGTIVSVAGELILPGREAAIGAAVTRFEPYLAIGQLLPHDSFVQFQGGVELSTSRDKAEHEAFWRTAIGRSLFEPNFGRAWTPMIELLGSRELSAESNTHWDIVPQLQVSLSRRQHVLLNVGAQVPLNDRDGRGTRLLTYLLWDWFDGSFFSGWR